MSNESAALFYWRNAKMSRQGRTYLSRQEAINNLRIIQGAKIKDNKFLFKLQQRAESYLLLLNAYFEKVKTK